MARNMLLCSVAAVCGLLATANQGAAQYYFPQQSNPLYRPPVSPYLNLARGGNPAINYYGVIRPQLDVGRQLQMLQQQPPYGYMPQFGVPTDEDQVMGSYSVSGHPVTFFNYSHFYGQGGAGMFGQGGGGLQSTQQQGFPLNRTRK